MLIDISQHGPQILQVDQQQPFVIRDPEHDMQNSLLHRRQAQNPAEKLRSHVADGGPDGVAALLINIPEGGGITLVDKAVPQAEFVDAFFHALAALARRADARHVALHITQKHRRRKRTPPSPSW